MQGQERVIYTLSVRRPHPIQYQPTAYRKKRKGKIVEDYIVGTEQLRPIKSTGLALETHQSHTIEYRVC